MTPPPPQSSGIEIGATLRDARRRQGLDIRAVEEHTKIRIKYLRALEAEEWEVLPAPAYVRGFLRTYAEMLGLEPEVLIDEYRSRGGRAGDAYPMLEPVISEPRRPLRDPGGVGRARQTKLIGGAVGIFVLLLLVLSLFGGDGEGGEQDSVTPLVEGGRAGRLTVIAQTAINEVCISNEDGEILFRAALDRGEKERLDEADFYLIDMAPGKARIVAEGGVELADNQDRTSYEAGAGGVNRLGPGREVC